MSHAQSSISPKKYASVRASERLVNIGGAAARTECLLELRGCVAVLEVWFAANARAFEWREGASPFSLLVAEILLRKTSAQAAAMLLPRVLDEYQSPSGLANSDPGRLQETLRDFGLSLQRATQLRKLGSVIEQQFQGTVPLNVRDLLQLPGIGAYSAASVASIAAGVRVPAVDSNVARVVLRVFHETPSHLEARKSPNIWMRAGQLLACWGGNPSTFNWALLDLAALICRPRNPKCRICPLNQCCAFANGEE